MKPIMPDIESPQQTAASLSIDQALEQAVSQHHAGRLAEAEMLYRAILQIDPNHPEANHNVGVLAVQMQQPAVGLPHFIAALEANPAHGQYWLSYIDALFQAGQAEAAREVLALAQQQGLQGDEVEALMTRLQGDAPIIAQQNTGHVSPESLPPSSAISQNNKKQSKTKSVKPNQPPYKNKAPNPQEIDRLSALFGKGQYAETASLARQMTVRFPRHGFGWKALGTVLMQLGQHADALEPLKKAAEFSPDDAYAHSNLGNLLSDLGRLHEAETSFRLALAIDPNFAEAHTNLGSTLQEMGRLDEAEASYRHALRIRPDLAEAHYNLGNNLKESGRLDEAEASYRRALQIKPDYAQALSNLGVVLNDLGRLDEAEKHIRQALQINPGFAQAYSNLGNALREMGRLNEAEASYRSALALKPDLAETYNNLGAALQDLGRLDEAETSYRRALQIKPDYTKAHSNLLFSLNHSASNPPSYGFAEARLYGQKVSQPVTSRFTEWSCSRQPERLRIGLVSGDFKNHPVGYFLENLLRHLDPAAVELIAYPTDIKADEFTARIKPCFTAWNPLPGLTDEAAARQIHSDSVHVLIDLSGHTRYNRLPIFAWKPAPVQVSWLGYFATTGVAEIDYLIADPWTLPETEETWFTECIWRLPETRLCFTPPDIDINIAPLPALTNGYVTFGCFNNLTKMNDEVVALWSRVLTSVPGSRLYLKAKQLKEASVQQRTIERFANHGIDASRLILEGPDTRANYLAAYHRVDIALDPFPYTGGTTSVESLWMGVPVLTLAGESFLARQGVGILMNVGLPEWVAADSDDYVARAVSLVGDLPRLAKLRASLRQQALASPLFNAERFARHFEEAMRGMWERTVNDNSPAIVRTEPLLKPSVVIVSATRLSEADFWNKSALGLSVAQHLKLDARLAVHVAYENSRGLPEIYNEYINQVEEDAILIFIHDDVWIDETDALADTVIAGLEHYDVIGVAGNRRRVPNQPAWIFIDNKFTWDDKFNLSGDIAHGENAFGEVSHFGTVPAECELLDGVFLATKKHSLKKNNVQFDAQFNFHFYDMDFCRSAREAGLRLGTWRIRLTHQSGGAFGSQQWKEKYQLYLKKWDSASVEPALQHAIALHQAGELQNAKRLYLDILQSWPNHPEANHNLGVLMLQMKQAPASLEYFMAALENDPARGQYWLSYIDALYQAGQFETAGQVLALARQHGLHGDDMDKLAARFQFKPTE